MSVVGSNGFLCPELASFARWPAEWPLSADFPFRSRIWAVTATTNPGLSVMPPQVCLLGSKRFTETSGIGKNIGT
ncbi:uncharacterized protein LOC132312158 isoform X4 [Cornus florida]|uniref:uncharacterized protein LOC132312158 isoform X4 n=1 Tax=Cornus florida TaxID=4283 RepID=UPI00289EBF7A|nr:uncharacterized protein LOC132312158 isoform X4 [Cornus florida]